MGEDSVSDLTAFLRWREIKKTARARGYATGAEIREMLDLAPHMGVDLRQHDFDGEGGCTDSCFCKSEGVDAA
tara:strand:- start:800 stop:1018 length:219 start_codon:yes stop_codon:yes gene_type:complete